MVLVLGLSMRRKPRRWVLWAVPSVVHGVLWLGLLAGFHYLDSLRDVTARLVCEPDEGLVTERMIYEGGNRTGYVEKSCCAKRGDTRTHGRCNWSNSFRESSDVLVGAVPLGISLGVATLVAGILWWVLFDRQRRTYRWARARARETATRGRSDAPH